ncbi:MAG: bifunctional diaminohydroxyphosphoribosylaminopyrimidine deaminase/5-amino-6-(5-phosphoribosylamino)uracil reductase RibD [Flavobacteriaceae bacterium]
MDSNLLAEGLMDRSAGLRGNLYFCLVKIQEKYMSRCIELAKNARGTAAPNPVVGCVIVHDKKIIGEGYTSPYGGPHAEVNAIRSVADKSKLTSSTLYVSLEPCSHHGKTPPCSELIIRHRIPRIVIGIRDPNELVAGKGIALLEKAGCHITEGVLNKQCHAINRDFFVYHQQKRPYIILKWAQTKDGYLAPDPQLRKEDPEPFWISSSHSRQLVHKWRTEEQAILAGTNTIILDNPNLTARDWHGKSPTRIILDQKLRIPANYKVFDKSSPTIILTSVRKPKKKISGIQYEYLNYNSEVAAQIVRILWKSQILSVIVEGGAKTLETFIAERFWDEARIITSAGSLNAGTRAPEIMGNIATKYSIGTDTLKIIDRD